MMQVTYLGHSGFLVEVEDAFFLFDYYQGELPKMDPGKTLFVCVSHVHYDHYNPQIFQLQEKMPDIQFLLSDDILDVRETEQVRQLSPKMTLEIKGARIQTLPSTDEGIAFLISYQGHVIYHAGDLNWWHWEGESEEYNRQMKEAYQSALLQLPDTRIDVAFVPVDLRLGTQYVWGVDYFMRHTDTARVFPMHFWGNYDVFSRLLEEPCTREYRKKIVPIEKEGQKFDIPDET